MLKKAFDEIFKIYTLLHRAELNILRLPHYFVEFRRFPRCFANCAETRHKSHIFADIFIEFWRDCGESQMIAGRQYPFRIYLTLSRENNSN